MKLEKITPVFLDIIPETLVEGFLYISMLYETASHLCCCGCRELVVTPLTKDQGWKLTQKDSIVSLSPSIGSFSLPCKSHYFITENKVVWC